MRTAPTDEATKDDLHGRIARIRRSIPRMARATIDRYIAASPLYTQTAVPEHLHRESAHTVRSMLEVCLRSVTDESIDVSDTMRENIERGTERVAEGLPLREYMRCWQAGFDVLAEELERELGTDHGLFWFAFRRAHTTFERILREVVSAYEIHAHDLIAAQDRNHAPIIDALLRGDEWVFDDPDSIPAEPSIMLLHIDDTPAERSGDRNARSLAATRKVRAIRAHLARAVPGLWLIDVRPRHARIVMHPPIGALDPLAVDLARVSGAPVTIAIENATSITDLPRAGTTAAEVLDIAIRSGRTGTVSRMTDVALAHHFAHPSASLPVLLDRCASLRSRPDLVHTLRVYMASNLDRRATADTLTVHPNTVDNRLNRVRELTGLDVHITTELLTLAVAVSAATDDPEAEADLRQ
ncbi:CdaR family transcriptional regulator [Rhodococcus opacus]|uniref:CdaR family transcriptional regulator n=1 Tax=Rhodococcus opacus TaxID=37919 RepID=A0A1B1K8Q2_RHOOP|nr:helix-turn-helix domain-containing protein [Rhodococcus opacus]ANS28938.1 CdaR family transcriptional regulator [Rhodococcus opacus]